MGIDFNELKKQAEGIIEQHGEKIEAGAEKLGEVVKDKFGHDEQVDKVVDKIQDMIPDKPRPGNQA
ncbi:Rv0909 family putative TA system antitoxin [Actinokineospora sp. NPDC004072]